MKILSLNALSVNVINDEPIALTMRNGSLTLSYLDIDLGKVIDLARFNGSIGFILGIGDRYLVSVDNNLYLMEEHKGKLVLKASNPKNFFWHAIKAEGRIFVHEYGEAPTGIYVSEDLEDWKRLITNMEIDRSSKHFHSIAYDAYRRWLITTLGDGCLTRAAYSEDLGNTWKPLYKGPWQFVPIEVLEDRIVFGMDSGIVRGGVGIYYPGEGRWDFIFLRWYDANVGFAQISELKLLDNGIWMAALGAPQAFLVSKDLKTWCVAHIEGFDPNFNYHVSIAEGKDIVIGSTGENLIIFDKKELTDLARNCTIAMASYKPTLIERLKGYGFSIKRMFI